MLVCFDESYDADKNFLLLGALLNPHPRQIHRPFRQAKIREGWVDSNGECKEVKYSSCTSPRLLRLAVAGVEAFMQSDSVYRCVVIDEREEYGWSLNYFGKPSERKALKAARAYTKFAELLLKSNSADITNGTLLTDRLTRCRGDQFLSHLELLFGQDGIHSVGKEAPTFKHVADVDTALERYHVGQIGDILTGVILNELIPATGKRGKYKGKLREAVKELVGVPSLGKVYWEALPKYRQDVLHPKFQVWYWSPKKEKGT